MQITGLFIGYGATPYGWPQIYAPQASTPHPTPTPTNAPVPGKHHGSAHYPKFRSEEEIRRDRLALWGIDKDAEPVVEKVAKKVIARARKAAESQFSPEPAQTAAHVLEWMQSNHEAQRKMLEGDLQRKRIDFSIQYVLLLRLEIEQQLAAEAEEEQVMLLLMEM